MVICCFCGITSGVDNTDLQLGDFKLKKTLSLALIEISLPQTCGTVSLPLSPLSEAESLHTNVLMDQVL